MTDTTPVTAKIAMKKNKKLHKNAIIIYDKVLHLIKKGESINTYQHTSQLSNLALDAWLNAMDARHAANNKQSKKYSKLAVAEFRAIRDLNIDIREYRNGYKEFD